MTSKAKKKSSMMDKIRVWISVLALMFGLGMVGFWAVDYFSADAAAEDSHAQQVDDIKDKFAEATPDPDPTPAADTVDYGETYATMRIPRFGDDYEKPIMEGTGRDVLDLLGVGHYEGTAQFGEVGNVGLAGHRNGYGAIFENITELQKGDKIYVETEDGVYTYVYDSQEKGLPTDVDVLLPVPNEPGVKPTEQLLTITTCEWWDNSERVIAYAHLESFEKRS